jgi:prepilin-type N-terminal cleavage/methylation domain-containing protein
MKTPRKGLISYPGNEHAHRSDGGYSLIELIVVVTIIVVLSAISIPYAVNFTKAYKSEDQAVKVLDLMRETAQLALNQRRTFRFELDINGTRPLARIIDETPDPDVTVKTIPLEPLNEIRMDAPAGVTRPNPPNYPNVAFISGLWSAKFKSDGSVVNASNSPVSATIYSYPPKDNTTTPRRMTEVRAITLYGGSGAVRYWKHNGTAFVPYQ